MRKFISILLLSLYSVATLGATLQMHYCGDELVDWKMSALGNQQEDDCCSRVQDECGTQKSHDCCKDIQVKVKADQNQILSVYKLSLNSSFYLPSSPIIPFYSTIAINSLDIIENNFANPPPNGLWQNIPLYILFQNKKFGNC